MSGRIPRRALTALAAVALSVGTASSHAADGPAGAPRETARPRTCLVLGGGGARGAAHVGLLKVLERERVPVDCIVGTSMGAIVGGMYASGYSAEQIESILAHVDWGEVLHDRTPRQDRSMRRKADDLRRLGGIELGIKDGRIAFPRGVIQGQRLELLLRRLLLPTWEVRSFDDLPIPFRAVAADIVTGEKVVFDRGELAMAIRASMSVPAAFAPIRVDGRLLVDGGVVDNVPIDEARKLGAERLIVSRVGSPLFDEAHLDSPLAINEQTSRVLMKRIVEEQVASLGSDDLLLQPPLGSLGAQEFNRALEAAAIGQAEAEAHVAAIRRFSVGEAEYADFQAGHVLPRPDPPLVAFVEILEEGTRTGDFVKRRLHGMEGNRLDLGALEDGLAHVYGENRYEQLQWRFKDEGGATGLQIEPLDKRWGPALLHASLRLSSDLDGASEYQLGGELTLAGLNPTGGEARLQLGLGRRDRLRGEWYQPLGKRVEHAWVAHAGHEAFDLPLTLVSGTEQAQFRYGRWSAGAGWRYAPTARWELRADAVWGRERTRLLVGDGDAWRGSRARTAGVGVGIGYDTLDSSSFPQRGSRLDIAYQRYLPGMGSDVSASVAQLAWDGVVSRNGHHLLAGVSLSSASDEGASVLVTHRFLGGLGYLSGYQDDAIFAPQTGLARAIYYRRLGHADHLMSLPLYAGASLEAGGFWRRREDVGRDGVIGAGSVFLGMGTGLGPVLVGYGRAERGVDSFYLLVGSLLREQREP
ncbi:patatin-like phospholipase family protein [Pseudoxanthomonas putridarboris]|uniref:Patatin-like phospholipase family protein n=1 Tax=Pseudoxanthomonas putridarboris TaxID=752605 RepID=A0ABU9J3Q9_9GAMM